MTQAERTRTLIDQILRLRRAEILAPGVEEIESVREDLERQLGPALTRGTAAHLVGVSQTALDRWVERGEIPTVTTPRGKRAVPASVVLDLAEGVRARSPDQRRPLGAVIREQHGRADDAERVARRTLAPLLREPREGHRTAELRSLALHAVVADRLNAGVLRGAQRRLRLLEREGAIDTVRARAWEELLGSPLPRIRRTLVQDTPEARDLRQNTPFAGVLSEPERRRVLGLVGGS